MINLIIAILIHGDLKHLLIYRATPQWFISMQKNDLREKAIKAINETIFYPKKERKDYYQWLKEDQIGVFQVKEFGEFLYQSLLIKKQKNH